MKLEDKIRHYKAEIDNISAKVYNGEQKALAHYILEHADEHNIDAIYTFITQRVKLGLTFDAAPEVNHNRISLIKRNRKLSFGAGGNNHKLIIGENYDALKNLLATYCKNGKGLIDVIYIDPPYNTEAAKSDGNDHKEDVKANKFVYRDKFTRNGWLNLMRERLVMARKLLSDTGVIFISIDDKEQAYLKVLCDEIFGEDNFIANLIWLKGNAQNDAHNIQNNHEYILTFANHRDDELLSTETTKNKIIFEENGRYFYEGAGLTTGGAGGTLNNRPSLGYTIYYNPKTKDKIAIADYDIEKARNSNIEKDIYTDNTELLKKGYIKIRPPKKGNMLGRWTWSLKKFNDEKDSIYIKEGPNGYSILKKMFVNNTESIINVSGPLKSFIDIASSNGTKILGKIFNEKLFDNPKPTELIKYLIKSYTKKNITILDFFAGSGTTGQAVMELNAEDGGNRQCILVTNDENGIAHDITLERLYRVINGVGTQGETFDWKYKSDKPYLSGNSWDVFELKYHPLQIDDFEQAQELLKQAKLQFKLLNPEYEAKDLDIYNQLAALNPYKEDENAAD